MFDLNTVSLGILFLAVGIGLVGLILLLTRFIPHLQPQEANAPLLPGSLDLMPHAEAVLMVQNGGRIVYLNDLARQWFKLAEGEPDLECLARRTRPSEAFLSLCAGKRQVRLSLDGHYLDGSSYQAAYQGEPVLLVTLRRTHLTNVALITDRSGSAGQLSPGMLVVSQFNQNLRSSLEIEATIQAIFDAIEQLIPVDFLEIGIWRTEESPLDPYYRLGMAGQNHQLARLDPIETPEGYRAELISSAPALVGSGCISVR